MIFQLILDAPQGGMANWSSTIFLVLIMLVFYFFMIRPQSKKQKEQRKFQDDIQKGDRIVTASGIHGKISELDERTLTLELENGKMKIERVAVSNELTLANYPKNKS
jgi:preprotein translocase subunit YajC